MRTFTLFTFFIIFLTKATFAQGPDIQWQHCYGGFGIESVKAFTATSDGGYIFAAETDSVSGDVTVKLGVIDFWIVKIDALGNIQWQKTYGSITGQDHPYQIAQTADGNYIVCGAVFGSGGYDTGFHGDIDSWVIKLGSSGNLLWQHCYGGTGTESPFGMSLTNDGGFILANSTNSTDGDVTTALGSEDIWIVKCDAAGNIQWQKSYGGSGEEVGDVVTQTSDGGYVFAGRSRNANGQIILHHGSSQYNDIWVVKIDALGNIQWQKTLGGDKEDGAADIKQAQDGSIFLLAGTSSTNGDISSNHGGYDGWIVKLNESGDLLWEKTYGGTNDDFMMRMKLTNDGGIAVGGFTLSTDGDVNNSFNNEAAWLVKLDASGNVQWQQTYGTDSGSTDFWGISYLADGSFALAGAATANGNDVSGMHINAGKPDAWVVKVGVPNSVYSIQNELNLNLYPNPAVNAITVQTNSFSSYAIYNIIGKTIMTGTLQSGENVLPVSALPSGTYILRSGNYTQKFVKTE